MRRYQRLNFGATETTIIIGGVFINFIVMYQLVFLNFIVMYQLVLLVYWDSAALHPLSYIRSGVINIIFRKSETLYIGMFLN